MKTIIAIMAFLFLTFITSNAQTDGIYYIKLANGKVLDADAPTVNNNGAKIQIWDKVGGENQKWELKKDYSTGNYTIKNMASGKYLDVDLSSVATNGGKVQLWDRVAANKNQQWVFTPFDQGKFTIHCAACQQARIGNQFKKVLDVTGYAIATNGTKVQIWDYSTSNTSNQIWYLEKTSTSSAPSVNNGRKILFTVDLNSIAVAENTRNSIDNGDCKRIFGEISTELYELDQNNNIKAPIPTYNSSSNHLYIEKNYSTPPAIALSKYADHADANRVMGSVLYNIDEKLLNDNKIMLVVKTNLGSRHKDNDYASYDILRMSGPTESTFILKNVANKEELIVASTSLQNSNRDMHILDFAIPHSAFIRTDDEHRFWVNLTYKRK